MTIRIAGIGTALPAHVVDQPTVRRVVEALFQELPEQQRRVLETFSHEHIQTRHFVRPPEWYGEPHGFGTTNDVFIQTAADLSVEAAQRALHDAGMTVEDVDGIVVATTTGLATPSLDSIVALRLGMRTNVARMPIVGLGCAAGVSGLARAVDMSAARDGRPVIFIAVETCSVTFQRTDTSKSNLVGASLFGDGAAAVIVARDGRGPTIRGAWSHLFPNTPDIMGWDVVDTGLKVRFSRDIPSFISTHVREVLDAALHAWNIDLDAIDVIIPHPGGAKVLDAYAQLLSRPRSAFDHARDVLATCGNMSSPTVLFVLARTLAHWPQGARFGLMTALGPGFSAECMLLEADADVAS